MKNRIAFASIIGNALEYYDFTIFAVFSSTMGQIFFPAHDEFAQMLLSLAVFSVGFLMRPLGGAIFGHIGDKYGRKQALTISIACMATPTFIIGVLPGYEMLGICSPVLLVFLRLIQGASIGGEGAGAAIFVLEHNEKSRPGFLASIVTASNIIGAFFATLVGLSISFFELGRTAWRYAFIFGGILGFLGFYLRIRASETPVFQKMTNERKIATVPFLKLMVENKKQMILSGCLGGISGAIAYMVLAYINLFFNKMLGFDSNTSLLYATLGIGSFVCFLPLFGYWSDRFGYNRVAIAACFGIAILAVPLFMMMASDNVFLTLVPVLVLGALGAWICAPAYPLMLQIFSPEQRYSGMAFSFNLGIALFGGTTPMIAALLTKKMGLIYAPSFYLVALALLFIGCHFVIHKDIQITD